MDILLATDGSFYALQAARFLRSRLEPAQVGGLWVVAVASTETGGNGGSFGAATAGVKREEARRWVDRTLEVLEGSGFPVEGEVRSGDAARTLVDLAGSGIFDLVVAGVKGQGAAPFFELGRVATALKQEVSIPVLLVRPPGIEPFLGWTEDDETTPFRVLLPTDGEGEGVETACQMLGVFRMAQGSVEIAALLGAAVGFPGESPRLRWAGRSREERRTRARNWLTQTLPTLETGQIASSSLLEGRSVREIERRIRETDSELVILSLASPGARGMGATRIAEELVWFAPCSVLLLRDAAPESGSPLSVLLEPERLAAPDGRSSELPLGP